MANYLCMAQAQYLFFRKARENNMAKKMQSSICAQIGTYFQQAYEDNQINPHLRAFENQHFANVLGYHSKYYNALAWSLLLDGQVEFVDKNSKECGKAVTIAKVALKKFDECVPFVNTLGGQYKQNFDKQLAETQSVAKRMMDENKKIYFD